MESIVTVVRGDSLELTNKSCIFCNKTEDNKLLAVKIGSEWDGILLRTFPICTEHFDKINALLSGEFDIDKILLEKYRKEEPQATLRFRG